MVKRPAAQFLTGSPDRVRLLAHLTETPDSPRDIADDLSVSHRSVQRNLAQLVERGWAEKRDGDYHPTTAGALVAARHADYVEALDVIDRLDRFYRHLPDRDHAPDPEWLRDADVAFATPDQPQAPVNHYIDSVTRFDTGRIRMISPVLSRLYHDAHAKLVLRGVETELVLDAETVDAARSMNPVEFEFVARVPLLAIHEHPGDVAFGLTLADEDALMTAYDDEGQLRACVECSHPEFLPWAERLYESYRERSTPLDVR